MIQGKKWSDFRIGDFFEVKRGKRIVKDVDYIKTLEGDYVYPVITSTTMNNSIDGYYTKYNCPENTVVCGGEASGFFATYQEEKTWVMDRSRIFTPNKSFKYEMNKNIGLFLVTIFRQERFKYSYGRSANPNHIMNTIISLPSNINDEPDWEYMDQYISEIWDGELISSIKKEKVIIDTSNWQEFYLGDIFEITGTKSTPLTELEVIGPGEFPYVTTRATNNSVAGFFDYWTEEGNVLIIDSAVIGYCSYQEQNFSASDHVEKLTPKFKMTKNVALFLVTLINKNTFRFSYGRKANQKQIRKLSVKLPVKNNVPDWNYIDNLISKLEFSDLI